MEVRPMTAQLWNQRERLTLWVLFDLERVAWVVEQRSTELTAGDRQLLHAVAARLERVAGEYER
jgi:hypothetical protein